MSPGQFLQPRLVGALLRLMAQLQTTRLTRPAATFVVTRLFIQLSMFMPTVVECPTFLTLVGAPQSAWGRIL